VAIIELERSILSNDFFALLDDKQTPVEAKSLSAIKAYGIIIQGEEDGKEGQILDAIG